MTELKPGLTALVFSGLTQLIKLGGGYPFGILGLKALLLLLLFKLGLLS